MTTARTIAASVDAAGDKARYDAACKRLLAEKIILAWIMKSTMKEYSCMDAEEIAENYIVGGPQITEIPVMPDERPPKIDAAGAEDVSITEGKVIFDMRFCAVYPSAGKLAGLIVNVEGQNDFYPGYPLVKRGIYYCGRMISSQYGTVFTDSHYEKIQKVYSVWICMNPPKIRENTINCYDIRERNLTGEIREDVKQYDLLSVIMICLGASDHAEPGGILHLLDVLLYGKMSAEARKRILSEVFHIPMTQQFERRIQEMCNFSEGVWQRGMEEGIEKNMLSSLKKLIKNLRITAEQAMDLLEVEYADREKYGSKLAHL